MSDSEVGPYSIAGLVRKSSVCTYECTFNVQVLQQDDLSASESPPIHQVILQSPRIAMLPGRV